MSNAKAEERLLRQLEGVESLEGCLELFEELKGLQDEDPEDHGLWELRLRVMRRLGKLLPPKHTGHGGPWNFSLERAQEEAQEEELSRPEPHMPLPGTRQRALS